jgi:hypothetical protein
MTQGSEISTATIVPFPAERQTGKIRHTALIYVDNVDRDGRWADGYWRKTVDQMARRLKEAGVDAVTIDREVSRFRHAVSIEVDRLTRLKAASELEAKRQ